MAGRISYYGGIVTNGLILDLDAAKRDSYPGVGTAWTNLIPNGVNGILTNGPTFSSANVGSIVFDGVDDFVNCGSSNITSFSGDLSVNCWVNAKGLTSANGGGIVVKRNSGQFPANYMLGVFTPGIFYFQINGTSPNTNSITGPSITYNTWYNVTAVRRSSTMELYYNAALQVTGSTPAGSSAASGVSLRVGQNHDSNAPFFGSIGLVHLYNRALSTTEILQNYNATKGRFGL